MAQARGYIMTIIIAPIIAIAIAATTATSIVIGWTLGLRYRQNGDI
jgi:hypothetical protein